MPDISVIVPTYRRTPDLHRCLQAMLKQDRMPDEIIVVMRETDEETHDLLDVHYGGLLLLKIVRVSQYGVVAALNAGLENATGEIIAITDDDAAPKPDWLLLIEKIFEEDPGIGGIGGRDWVYHDGVADIGAEKLVGKVQWFGRVVGNHHLGVGVAREVDFLKGVNMSYRRDAIVGIRFQTCLRGTGAQVHNEMGFSMEVKKAGWKLVYIPDVAVDHYPARRHDEDQRNTFSPEALSNAVHNESYIIHHNFGFLQRTLYLVWTLCIGSGSTPGFANWIRLIALGKTQATSKWLAVTRGVLQGVRTWRKQG